MENIWRVTSQEGEEWRGKMQGIRSIIVRYKIDGEVKNSLVNGEAKELICTTHRHELWWGIIAGSKGDTG